MLRPGVVAVGDRELEYDELVVATGSVPAIPPLEGLDDVDYWTSREAIWASSIPASLIVLGAGSAGEHFVGALRRLDDEIEIAVVEHGLAGGECSYYACLPTKTLLRPGEALAGAQHAPGAAEAVTGVLDHDQVWGWRDFVTDGRSDGYHVGWLAEQRAELVRGEARVVREGVVSAGERELEYDELVIATGSSGRARRDAVTLCGPGEVSERPKERDWKSRTCRKVRRGFKSRPLR